MTKSDVWAYEEEVRAIYSKNNIRLIEKNDKYYCKMKKLVSITLGYRVTEKDKLYFIKFSQRHKIRLYQMELSNTSFDLIRKKIEY